MASWGKVGHALEVRCAPGGEYRVGLHCGRPAGPLSCCVQAGGCEGSTGSVAGVGLLHEVSGHQRGATASLVFALVVVAAGRERPGGYPSPPHPDRVVCG